MFGDRFANPAFLWLLLALPAAGAYLWWRRREMQIDLQFSSLIPFRRMAPTVRERLQHLPLALRMLALAAFAIAMARPQSVSSKQNVTTEGIDIVLLLDMSGSMLAEDFTPNRLEAAKQVASEFIDGRANDRIGLVVFAAESFTQCPLTTDYPVLKNLLRNIKKGMVGDRTAIGLAIANGVNRVKESKAKSKVMVLLTDGVNNSGEIDPITAARIAATFGVRIYTVGVGAQGQAPYPVETPFGIRRQLVPVELDEKALTSIAEMTGGVYFRATDNRTLRAIYKEIDRLEKTKIEVTAYRRYTDFFPGWLLFGLVLISAEAVLRHSVLRTNP
jgi:Ca-activated chloride channel family protein